MRLITICLYWDVLYPFILKKLIGSPIGHSAAGTSFHSRGQGDCLMSRLTTINFANEECIDLDI
jgi:hypothetical protein